MILKIEYAPVMELVDMRDLGSRAAMRVGSSPFRRTKNPLELNDSSGLFCFVVDKDNHWLCQWTKRALSEGKSRQRKRPRYSKVKVCRPNLKYRGGLHHER